MSDVLPLQLVAVTCRDLHAYELTCTLRLVCKQLCALLADAVVPIRIGPTHGAAATSAFSCAVPLHAVLWALTDAPTRRTLTLKTRLRLLEVAVSRCHTEDQLRQLEPALSRFGGPVTLIGLGRYNLYDTKPLILDPARAAAASSNRTALLWLRSRGWPLDPDGLLHAAARHADLPFLQWLHATFLQPQTPATAADSSLGPRPRLKDTTFVAAAASTTPDALDKVSWLVSHGCYVSGQAACAAAAQGNLPVLQLLAAQGGWTPDSRALQAALRAGHTHVADWLVRQGYCSLTSQGVYETAVKGVASGGRVASMEWVQQQAWELQQQGEDVWEPPLSLCENWLRDAAEVGACAEVLNWMVGLGADPSKEPINLVTIAARSGSTATVRHLLDLGARVEPTGAALRTAACCKDITLFKWLMRETECKWGESTVREVLQSLAGRGTPDSLAVVQWFVREREYSPGGYHCAVTQACWAGDVAVVRWLVEELGHQPGPNALNAAANSVNAAEQGDLEMLQLLWTRQVPWGADTTVRLVHPRTSSCSGPTQLASLRWLLLDAAVPSDLRLLLDRARRKKRPDIVQLVEQAAARQQQQERQGDSKAARHSTSKVWAAMWAVWGRPDAPFGRTRREPGAVQYSWVPDYD